MITRQVHDPFADGQNIAYHILGTLDRVLPAPVAAPPPTRRVQGSVLIPLAAFGLVYTALRKWWN